MDDTQKNVINWIATGSVGMSSECMALWLAFGERSQMQLEPADPADFDRCLRLLAAAPGLRERLPKMAELSPRWAALVARWDEVEASHLAEVGLGWTKARTAPETFALMRSILDPLPY